MPKAVSKSIRPYTIKLHQVVIPENEGDIGQQRDDDGEKEEYENIDDGDDDDDVDDDADDDDEKEVMKIVPDHADFTPQKVRMQFSLGILFPRYAVSFFSPGNIIMSSVSIFFLATKYI